MKKEKIMGKLCSGWRNLPKKEGGILLKKVKIYGGDTCELANFPVENFHYFSQISTFLASCIILEDLKKTSGNRTWYHHMVSNGGEKIIGEWKKKGIFANNYLQIEAFFFFSKKICDVAFLDMGKSMQWKEEMKN